jgi:tRNA 2-thiouridine synthesizing protein E
LESDQHGARHRSRVELEPRAPQDQQALLRKISKRSETPIKSIYKLFPDGPAKLVAKIAGIPKPKSCL